jgi:hypothetical protein
VKRARKLRGGGKSSLDAMTGERHRNLRPGKRANRAEQTDQGEPAKPSRSKIAFKVAGDCFVLTYYSTRPRWCSRARVARCAYGQNHAERYRNFLGMTTTADGAIIMIFAA